MGVCARGAICARGSTSRLSLFFSSSFENPYDDDDCELTDSCCCFFCLHISCLATNNKTRNARTLRLALEFFIGGSCSSSHFSRC